MPPIDKATTGLIETTLDVKKPLKRYAVRVSRLSGTTQVCSVVETAGIEPASANPLPEGATCLDPSLI